MSIPRDGRLISLILASKGIQDADDRVIQQLLDFAHRYSADVLSSAQSLADHAARGGSGVPKIEKEDVELAIQMRKRYEFYEAPPRDYLATLAHDLNSHPLPALPETFDVIRLPPPHQRLAEVDFNLIPDPDLVFDDGQESESDEEEQDDEEAEAEPEDDAEGEDEEMEEVGVPVERPIDEDYDA